MPSVKTSWAASRTLAERALSEPGRAKRLSATTIRWIASGDCEAPVDVIIEGRPYSTHMRGYEYEPGKRGILVTELEVRCRSCNPCLRARARHWAARANVEYGRAPRSWFSTMTVSPEYRQRMLWLAQVRAADVGSDFEALSDNDRFTTLCWGVGRELQRWLKRVRKQSASRLRYVAVFERHKDGFPHVHAILHETVGGVTERILRNQWSYGHSKHVLARSSAACHYVCKYLAKSKEARIRASLRYGWFDGSTPIPEQGPPLGYSPQLAGSVQLTETYRPAGSEVIPSTEV